MTVFLVFEKYSENLEDILCGERLGARFWLELLPRKGTNFLQKPEDVQVEASKREQSGTQS